MRQLVESDDAHIHVKVAKITSRKIILKTTGPQNKAQLEYHKAQKRYLGTS